MVQKPRFNCSLDAAMSVIEGRWKPTIICLLAQNGSMRFNELLNKIGEVSSRMLSKQLKELEAEGGEAANIARVHHRAEFFRKECEKYGWPMPTESKTFAITAIQTADTAERKVFRGLIEKYNTFIMPGGIPGFYRISHMGEQSDEELATLAARIREFEAPLL